MEGLLKIVVEKKNANCKKICIVSIIEKEMIAIIDRYNLQVKTDEDGNCIWCGKFLIEKNEYYIDCHQMLNKGNIESAICISTLLRKNYDYYFMIGTAGSAKLNLYDVMLVSKAVYNGTGSHEKAMTLYDTDIKGVTNIIKNRYQAFSLYCNNKLDLGFNIQEGVVYSSNFVEQDPENTDYNAAQNSVRSIKAVEMEAYGAVLAEEFIKQSEKDDKHVVIIRGISDRANDGKNSVYEDGISPADRKILATANALITMERYCEFCDSRLD